MDYIKSAVLILCCFFLFSCGGSYTKNETILRAESLLYTAPDSSYRLLTSITHPERLSKADYAAWCLQYTYAQYKLYMDIKSDSTIRIAVDYYDRTNLYKQNGTAYYLLGCIQKAKKQKKEALIAFKKANQLLEKTQEIDLIGVIRFNIGDIYLEDEIFDQSLSNYKKALNCFISSKNTKYQAYAYRQIADMSFRLRYPFDKVMYYSNIALKLSKQAGDTINYYSILAQQGEMLYDKDYLRSKECLLKVFRYFPALKANHATLLSYIYSKLHQPDSAKYYLNISIKEPVESKYKVVQYFLEAYVTRDGGDIRKAFNLYEKAYSIRNAFFKETVKNQLYQLDKQYDLTQKEKENATLKIDNRNKVIVITLFTIVFLIGLIVFITLHNRNKSNRIILDMENQRLHFEVEKKKTENEKKNEILLSKLQNKVENTLQFNRLKMGITSSDKLEAFLEEIKKQSMISDSEWKYYMEEINNIFDNKLSHLMNSYSQLTDKDLNVITLICLKLDISDCCNLLNMTKNALYHRRNIMKERMSINKDKDLEEWVWEYLISEFKDE